MPPLLEVINKMKFWLVGLFLLIGVGLFFIFNKHKVEPQQAVLMLVDSRSTQSTPLYTRDFFSSKQLEKNNLEITVDPAINLMLVDEAAALYEQFEKSINVTAPPRLFFALKSPSLKSAKYLRQSIEQLSTLHPTTRHDLFTRLIVVKDTKSLKTEHDCQEILNTIEYAHWNFLGIALVVDDSSVKFLKDCLPRFIMTYDERSGK